ncbi:sulfotransferase [Thioalkalivibrio sp. ALE12]|uniref:sulfotransferase n=1 Tax=Thioalkalivibrio sp. ALE12 TaxID=1158170 RepID=UPI0012DD134D|nr:sulfotransferase [Thioalkalivibrio sp. ALE12]
MLANTCVVVMGPYRSGTSLSAQILSVLGVEFGNADAFQLAADRFNPGGYFQRRDIVRANQRLINSVSDRIGKPAEPKVINAGAPQEWLDGVDLGWMSRSRICGLKDPRFCVTLLTWIDRSGLPAENLLVVRVVRDLSAIARSSVRHREVGSFCDYDLGGALEMARAYDYWAGWHAEGMGLPVMEISYERLVLDPESVVFEVAEFVGQSDSKVIHRARLAVGKRRALIRHYAHKLLDPRLMLGTARKTFRSRRKK